MPSREKMNAIRQRLETLADQNAGEIAATMQKLGHQWYDNPTPTANDVRMVAYRLISLLCEPATDTDTEGRITSGGILVGYDADEYYLIYTALVYEDNL